MFTRIQPRVTPPIAKGLLLLPLLVALLTGCGGAKEVSALSVGDPAPEFTLPSADGRDVSLSDLRGRTNVLLYFNMAAG